MCDIGIVVLNYVNYSETIKCVSSLLKQENVSARIVIVENGSGNESAERLRGAFDGEETVNLKIVRINIKKILRANFIRTFILRKICISIFFEKIFD